MGRKEGGPKTTAVSTQGPILGAPRPRSDEEENTPLEPAAKKHSNPVAFP